MLYPVFLKLNGRRVLLVGGGRVAASKLRALVDAGARVSVVAPDISREIASVDGIEVSQRRFRADDLDGAWFVVAAATRGVNREVAAAAEERGLFVNAVDDVESASAYAAAMLSRGGVTIALSTGGDAPALAGLLREALEVVLPEDLEAWMACARDIRPRWIAAGVPMAARRPLLLDALVALYADRSRASSGNPVSVEMRA
jgi:uroporphyrin-III C-methyltransferase/precorrin-2 dehydrogenase/sirohydrochlorin ferrochelatase